MSGKNKKQFGVWMDTRQATIVGRDNTEVGTFKVLVQKKNKNHTGNSNENTGNNAERGSQTKFFKEIASYMQNVEELHVTGTGQLQEQFISFMAETPQFKNAVSNHSTTNKMSDEALVTFITEKFN